MAKKGGLGERGYEYKDPTEIAEIRLDTPELAMVHAWNHIKGLFKDRNEPVVAPMPVGKEKTPEPESGE